MLRLRLIAGSAIYLGFSGDPIDGIWFALLGVFLGQAARGAVVSSEVSERIEGVTVADLMDTDPVTMSADDRRRSRPRSR